MSAPPKKRPGRVEIQAVSPSLDCGRYPVKRTPGEELRVRATIVADGHDILGAALRYRAPRARRWSESAMAPLGNDRWEGVFGVEALGRWQYTITAWIDRFASWQHELERKVGAGQADVSSELAEGAALLGLATLTVEEALEAEPELPRVSESSLAAPLEL